MSFNKTFSVAKSEIIEGLNAKWFYLYTFVFFAFIILLFLTGITESQVRGFTGINRALITYIQICMVVLPLFVLIPTVKSVVGDREDLVTEYLLSMPLELHEFFIGKFVGRFLLYITPLMLSLILCLILALINKLTIPFNTLGIYVPLLIALTWCFMGIAMFLSHFAKKMDFALGLSFFTWVTLLSFLDIIFIALMMKYKFNSSLIVGVSLLNPLQVFRTTSILLFDPQLASMGPAAGVILERFGSTGLKIFSFGYLGIIGTVFSYFGYKKFSKNDLC